MSDTTIELHVNSDSSNDEEVNTEDILVQTNYEKLDKAYNYRNTLMTIGLLFFMFNCVSIVISIYNIVNILLIAIGLFGIWNVNICLLGYFLIYCILKLIFEIFIFTYNIDSADEFDTVFYTFNILISTYTLELILRYIIQIYYLSTSEKQVIKEGYNARNRKCILC